MITLPLGKSRAGVRGFYRFRPEIFTAKSQNISPRRVLLRPQASSLAPVPRVCKSHHLGWDGFSRLVGMATLDLSLSPPRHPESLLAWLAWGRAVASHSRNPFKGRGSPGGLELLWSLPCRSPLACEQSCFLPSLGSSGLKLGGTLWDREDTRAGRTCGWLLPKYRVGGNRELERGRSCPSHAKGMGFEVKSGCESQLCYPSMWFKLPKLIFNFCICKMHINIPLQAEK